MIQKHLFAIVVALLVGLASLLHYGLLRNAMGSSYDGIIYSSSADDYVYLTRIHEVLDGHPLLGSALYHEYKDQLPVVLPFGEYFYAFPAYITGFGGDAVLIYAKFLFPVLLFLVIYGLFLSLVGEASWDARFGAVAVSLLIVLGYELVDVRFIMDLFLGNFKGDRPLWVTRPVNPITGLLLLFGGLSLLLRVTKHPRAMYGGLLALFLICASSYVFSFAILTVVALLWGFFLWKRGGSGSRPARVVWGGACAGLLVLIPYISFTSALLTGDEGKSFALRNGMFFSHMPIINKFLLAISLVYACGVWFWQRRRRNQEDAFPVRRGLAFGGVLLLASWIAFNQQILTGRTIWPAHFVQYTIPIGFFVTFSLLFIVFRPYMPRLWRGMMIGVALVSVLVGTLPQRPTHASLQGAIRQQVFFPLLSFLNSTASRDCVVLTQSAEVERLVPAYTGCNLYAPLGWNFSGVPLDRVRFNYLVALRLRGVTEVTVADYLLLRTDELRGIFFRDWIDLFGHGEEEWISDLRISLGEEYKTFLKLDFMTELARYRLDYLVADQEIPQAVKMFFRARALEQRLFPGGLELYRFR